jgi:hypothetical protein
MTDEEKKTVSEETVNGAAEDSEAETSIVVDGKDDQPKHEELRRRILAMRDKSESDAWELGILLEEAYTNDLYRTWGFDSWTEYVEQELDIHRRKAQYLVKLQKWFATMTPGIQKWVRELGWTKARMIMGVVDRSNATEWRHRVEGKTVEQIKAMVSASRDGGSGMEVDEGGSSEPVEKARRRSFSLFPDQDEIVTKALEKAAEVAESDKEGHLLAQICMDFLANATDMFSRDDLLGSIERNLGLRILAMVPNEDPEKEDDIVYGHEYLSREEDE